MANIDHLSAKDVYDYFKLKLIVTKALSGEVVEQATWKDIEKLVHIIDKLIDE